jgi:WD40 repeat protein
VDFHPLSQFQSEQLPWSLTFHPQAPHLFIGDAAGNLLCHDVMNGARLTTLQWHEHPVVAVGCYQNELYSFDQLQNLVSWNLSTFQVNQTYSLSMPGGMPWNSTPQQQKNYSKGDLVEVSWLHKSVNGNYMKLTKLVPLWTVATARFTHGGRYLFFGVDAHQKASYGVSTLYMIDVETGSLVREFDYSAFFSCRDVGSIDAIAISRDDTQLAASGLDVIYSSEGDWSNSQELIHQWCIDDGEQVCAYEYDACLYRPSAHEKIDLAFSPDMGQILCSRQGWLSLWKVPSPESRRLLVADENCNYQSLPIHSPGVFDWSPVSNLVAFGSPSGLLKFIDIATVEILFEQQVSQTAIQQVLFSQNGEFLAVYSEDLTVEIWSIA